jgi:hypothetical protein
MPGIGMPGIAPPKFNLGISDSIGKASEGLKESVENTIDSFNIMMTKIIGENLKREDPNFIEKMSTKIIDASTYHLLKPEGRQMYLRIFDDLLDKTSISITEINPLIIPLFINCLKSSVIKNIITSMNKPKGSNRPGIEEFIEKLKTELGEIIIKTHPIGGMYKDLLDKKLPKKLIFSKLDKDEQREYTGGKKSRNQKYLYKSRNKTRKRK